MNHPAPYNWKLLPVFDTLIQEHAPKYPTILDPFAGVGRIFSLQTPATIVAIDIEQWPNAHPEVQQGNALCLNYDRQTFDVVCTSPTYGNRMADHFEDKQPQKQYRRNTYRHRLGKPLQEQNSGAMQWGPEYRSFHEAAWAEVLRVLRPGGLLILNIKDHIRGGKRQRVSGWHYVTLQSLGFSCMTIIPVRCQGLRHGANRERIGYELVMAFRKMG